MFGWLKWFRPTRYNSKATADTYTHVVEIVVTQQYMLAPRVRWCENNLVDRFFVTRRYGRADAFFVEANDPFYDIYRFKNERDAFAFKMRWHGATA